MKPPRSFAKFFLPIGGLFGLPAAATAEILPYADLPDRVPSSAFNLQASGTSIAVDKFGDLSYARFAFTGTADLVVSTGTTTISAHSISPLSQALTGTAGGNTLSFSLSRPSKLIVSITSGTSSLEKLLIFADGPEIGAPQIGDPGVDDVTAALPAGWQTNPNLTSHLQAAINVSAASGHILYFPNGKYSSDQLKFPSNSRIHLASGALLKAITGTTGSPAYPHHPYATGTQKSRDSTFLYIGGNTPASQVTFSGRGVLDGNGFAIRSLPGDQGNSDTIHNIKLLRADQVTGLTIKDLYLRDSARWTIHLLKSDTVTLSNVKVMNDLRNHTVTNTDGCDIDACQEVTVENSFFYTYDDGFSAKTSGQIGRLAQCHNVMLKNNVIRSTGVALRIGGETVKDIYDIWLNNTDVFLADRFLGLEVQAGAATSVRNVVATNNRVEAIGGGSKRAFFFHQIDVYPNKYNYTGTKAPSNSPGTIDNNTVNGLYASGTAKFSEIRGQQETVNGVDTRFGITNFQVKNMYLSGTVGAVFSGSGGTVATGSNPVPFYFRDLHPSVSGSSVTYAPLPAAFANVIVSAPGTDGPPTVEVATVDDWAKEGADTGTFLISRLGALANPLVVNFSLAGSAVNGSDYETLVTSATIPAGKSQTAVTVRPSSDGLVTEGNETVILSLSSGSNYVVSPKFSSGTLTIADAPAPGPAETVTLTHQDASASETVGAPGSPANNPGKFRFTRSGAGTAPLTVHFTMGGSATRGTDYALAIYTSGTPSPVPGNTATIPAGATSLTIQLDANYDGIAEGGASANEKAIMTLAPGAGYSAGLTTSGTVVIHDYP
jgi:polygalacturonase